MIWLASAPLHEASITTKSGTMLKAETGRRQLGFASDNPPCQFQRIVPDFSYTKLHSEVASTTHIPALNGFEKALRCFLVLLRTEGPPTNAAFKNAAEARGTFPAKDAPFPIRQKHTTRDELFRQTIKLLLPAETYNKPANKKSRLN